MMRMSILWSGVDYPRIETHSRAEVSRCSAVELDTQTGAPHCLTNTASIGLLAGVVPGCRCGDTGAFISLAGRFGECSV